jgi:cytochrome c-type biogenesis protein CcmH
LATHQGTARFLAIAVMTVLLATSIPAGFASSSKTTLQEVSEALTCQCGCGLTVANCNHPQCEFSVPAREQIEKMIAQGMGRDRIIGVFRARYGEKILSAPTSEGFNLLAWSMPFVAVFAGCFIIFGAISRWRARTDQSEESGLSLDDPELKQRLQREIQEER